MGGDSWPLILKRMTLSHRTTGEAPAEMGSQRRSFQWYWGAPKSGRNKGGRCERPLNKSLEL